MRTPYSLLIIIICCLAFSAEAGIELPAAKLMRPFLTKTKVLSLADFLQAPYVVGQQAQQLKVRRLDAPLGTEYWVLQRGTTLIDPQTNTVLGIVANYRGMVKLTQQDDPARLQIIKGNKRFNNGDRLFPMTSSVAEKLSTPQRAENKVSAQIIAVLRGNLKIKPNNIVVLNYGADDDARSGQILKVVRQPALPLDTFIKHKMRLKMKVKNIGTVILFRCFPKVSFALVLRATSVMYVLDHVVTSKSIENVAHRH